MGKRTISTSLVSAAVVASMAFATPAWATIEGDQTPASDEEIAAAIASGEILTEDPNEGSEESGISLMSAKGVYSPVSMTQMAGATMYETAVAEAKAAYSSSPTVVLAGPEDAWTDALSAAGLAGCLDCPILFTYEDTLHPATRQALKDLGAQNVIIVGGPEAISTSVESDLKAAGVSVKARLGGADCYGTQMEIYQYGKDNGLWTGRTAFVATGGWFGDALSASPVAFATKSPIFLSRDGGLDSAQRKAIEAGLKSGEFGSVVMVGGPDAISQATGDSLQKAAQAAGGSFTRLWGAEQYETSVAIAKWAVSSQGFKWDSAAFATGYEPYDALAGSVLQGKSKSVLLLVGPSSSATISAAASNKGSIASLRFFGGKNAIKPSQRMAIADAFGAPYAALPDFKVYVDAGHGQNDAGNGYYAPGACANGYEEATLTRELANLVGNELRNTYGVSVYVNDDGGPYKYRHAEAVALDCDAIVSIHFNAGGGTGSESLRHSYNAAEYSQIWQFQIHPYLINGVGLTDRGKKTQEVAILGGQLPATLLEVCFIDNWSDMNQYQARKGEIARQIAAGIVE